MTGSELQSLMKISPDSGHKAVFAEYYNYVYTIVYNKLRSSASREDMEECVCDVFADLFLELDKDLEYNGDLAAYVNTIAKNKAIDMFRRLNAQKNSCSKVSDSEIGHIPDRWRILKQGNTVHKEDLKDSKPGASHAFWNDFADCKVTS